jgi:hypothetical protein
MLTIITINAENTATSALIGIVTINFVAIVGFITFSRKKMRSIEKGIDRLEKSIRYTRARMFIKEIKQVNDGIVQHKYRTDEEVSK